MSVMDRIETWMYLRHLGRTVKLGMQLRSQMLRELSQLDAHPATALLRAGRIGLRCAASFDQSRRALRDMAYPAGAQSVHEALLGWLDIHIEACDALTRAAGTKDARHLSSAASVLRGARPFAHRYNAARLRLAERLAA
jgi:hypothetical protein